MKKLLLLALPFALFASELDVKEEIEFLKERIKKLEQQMNENAANKAVSEVKLQNLQEQVNNNKADLAENIPILEAVEKKSILDRINFSPELEVRLDKMDYKLGDISGEDTRVYEGGVATNVSRRDAFTKNFQPAGLIRFKLNMSAQIDESVKFNGRLIFANSSQSNQRLCILSDDIKSNPSTSAFDVERAYFDYAPNMTSELPFTFSFGLLPTTGGTPMQFAQNTERKSMFPALVFDMNTYGVIGTQKLSENFYARGIVAKAYTLREAFYPYQCNRENIDNANVVGIYFDKKVDFLGDSLLSFGVNMLHDLKAHPYLGPDIDSTNAHILGNMLTFGVGVDIKKVAQSDFTVFAHTAISNPHANGAKDDYQIVNPALETTLSGDVGFSTADYAQGGMLKDNGYALYIGAKYDFLPSLNFGLEYNYGSKYWFSATQGAEDIYNKLATRGSVAEAYATWEFHDNMNAKLGYMYTDEQYTGSGWHFGEPASKEGTQSIGYLSITAKY
jgi:hypothetical protein